eukprot:m.17766 g.17766  ORF g.17766 m.17766 type:complete len:187 (+) comp27551_c0_seq2:23-583(+)
MEVLHAALSRVLGSWRALKVAVEHGFGGIESKEKEKWLPEALIQIQTENASLDEIEIGDYLNQIVFEEFDLIVEDGSLSQVSAYIHRVFSMWKRGATDELALWLQTTFPQQLVGAPVITAHQQPEQTGQSENEEEAMECEASVDACGEVTCSVRSSDSNNDGDDGTGRDGWTVVQRTGKKKTGSGK